MSTSVSGCQSGSCGAVVLCCAASGSSGRSSRRTEVLALIIVHVQKQVSLSHGNTVDDEDAEDE